MRRTVDFNSVADSTTFALLLAIAGAIPASSLAQSTLVPNTFYPVDAGLKWTYSQESGLGERTVLVMKLEENIAVLDIQGTSIRVQVEPDLQQVDIDLPGEGFQPYYRFTEDTWLHRDYRGCDDGVNMVVGGRDDVVDTPFSSFDSCIHLQYGDGGHCADAGTGEEWWAPGVGLVKWTEQSFAGPRTWVLVNFLRGDTPRLFQRGDADGSGVVEITDAVYILNWLFLGAGSDPACLDAADANDDGFVNVSDPVAILFFEFLGADPLPPPGAISCGLDPTDDSLPPCGVVCP